MGDLLALDGSQPVRAGSNWRHHDRDAPGVEGVQERGGPAMW